MLSETGPGSGTFLLKPVILPRDSCCYLEIWCPGAQEFWIFINLLVVWFIVRFVDTTLKYRLWSRHGYATFNTYTQEPEADRSPWVRASLHSKFLDSKGRIKRPCLENENKNKTKLKKVSHKLWIFINPEFRTQCLLPLLCFLNSCCGLLVCCLHTSDRLQVEDFLI